MKKQSEFDREILAELKIITKMLSNKGKVFQLWYNPEIDQVAFFDGAGISFHDSWACTANYKAEFKRLGYTKID